MTVETFAVAATSTVVGEDIRDRVEATIASDPDFWPVQRGELDAVVAQMASERGWIVQHVGDPLRRGPILSIPASEDEPARFCWQLYAYVDVEVE